MAEKKRRQYGTGTVFQRADGKWIGRIEAGYTGKGTRRRVSVLARTEAECKRRLKDKLRLIEAEGPGAITVTRPTVKAWCDTWLTGYERNVRPKTYATDASIVRKWIVPAIGHRRLTDLTPADVRKVTESIRDAGRSSTTAGYAVAILRRILKAAILEGHRVPERVLLVEKPEAAVSDRDALTLTDATDVLAIAAARPDGSRWVAALLQGMRQAECLGLTWDAVDLERRRVDVSWQLQALPYKDRLRETFRVPDGYEVRRLEGAYHLTRPKTEKGQRFIPLVSWMENSLTAWREVAPVSPHGLVWPRENGWPQNSKTDRESWVALQDEARVAHVDGRAGRRYLLHECRHSTASLLSAAKVPPEVIKAILGWSAIVANYMHSDDGQARAALDGMAVTLGLPQLEG